jgi:hypothetical protein
LLTPRDPFQRAQNESEKMYKSLRHEDDEGNDLSDDRGQSKQGSEVDIKTRDLST